MTHKDEFEQAVKLDVEARVRQGVKAVLEEVLREEMTEHLNAGYRELTPSRKGERNGHYQRNLLTPAGRIEHLEVPRDREGEFVTELFERYKRLTGNVEEAILEMYLSGISTRKVAGITDALSRVRIGKDAVSRIAARLEKSSSEPGERGASRRATPLPVFGRHVSEGRLGGERDEHGPFDVRGGGRGGFSGSVGGRGRWRGEERGLRLAAWGASWTGASRG